MTPLLASLGKILLQKFQLQPQKTGFCQDAAELTHVSSPFPPLRWLGTRYLFSLFLYLRLFFFRRPIPVLNFFPRKILTKPLKKKKP